MASILLSQSQKLGLWTGCFDLASSGRWWGVRLRYLDLLQKFKRGKLDFFSISELAESDRVGFATELLALARFEPQLIACAIQTVQEAVPILPKTARFELVRSMCMLVEDFYLYEGRNTYAFLSPLLVVSLDSSEVRQIAEHFRLHLRPDHVSRAHASLWGLTFLFEGLEKSEHKVVFSDILHFIKTRTIPDREAQAVLFELFTHNPHDAFGMVLTCVAAMLLDQKDPAHMLLHIGFFEKIFSDLEPLQKKHLLKDLHFLMTHSYRTVVNATLRFYKSALMQIPSNQRSEVLQLLMTFTDGIEYHEELKEIFSNCDLAISDEQEKKTDKPVINRETGDCQSEFTVLQLRPLPEE